MDQRERLQKIIAQNTEYSRRKAEKLIEEGKVKVNGKVVRELGTKASMDDEIIIGDAVLYREDLAYYLLNKPINVISSTSDDRGRDVITNYVPRENNVYPVGRLDFNTTGLIILTNDGLLANGLMHPSNHIEKTYDVTVKGSVSDTTLIELRKGVKIENYTTNRAKVRKIKYNRKKDETKLEVTIFEGRNRQIRKMFDAFNHHVIKLKRVKYGIFDQSIEKLPLGAYRELKTKEIKMLHNMIKK